MFKVTKRYFDGTMFSGKHMFEEMTSLEKNIVKLFIDGFTPNEIDNELGLSQGFSREKLVDLWKTEKRVMLV